MPDVDQAGLHYLLTMPLTSKLAHLSALGCGMTCPFPYMPQVSVKVAQLWGKGQEMQRSMWMFGEL